MLHPSDTESDDSGHDDSSGSDSTGEVDVDVLFAGLDKSGGGQASRTGTLERSGMSATSRSIGAPGGEQQHSGTLPRAPAAPPQQHQLQNASMAELESNGGHGQMLELYVLVARCIAFPFTAQARNSMSRTRHLKLTESDLLQYRGQFEAFLKGEMTSIKSDDAFDKAILCYYDNFLISKRLLSLVLSGGCTFADLRKVFQNYVERFLKNLPLMERVAHDHVLAIWMSKYEAICRGNEDMETMRRDSLALLRERQSVDDSVAPDHLYKVFQIILGIPQREHHLLSKELQLDNADEQATVIRRELRHRLTYLAACDIKGIARTLLSQEPNMAQDYLAEQHSHITKLRNTLNQMPVSKKTDTLKRPKSNVIADDVFDPSTVNKSDISISTNVSLTVRQARGIEFLAPDKPVFCVMEMDGYQTKKATAQYPASRPIWDTFATFPTTTPLPHVRIKLMADSKGILDADGRQIAKLTLQPTLCQADGDRWYKMTATVSLPDKNHSIEVQASVSLEKADNIKISGWLYCIGRDPWKKWKKHYFVLVQMTTYAFALCTFRDKQQTPSEVMTLTGCTVDYCGDDGLRGFSEEGFTEFQFQVQISESSVVFCSSSRSQMEQWVYQLARATGQTYRPQAPQGNAKGATLTRAQGKTASNALRELELDEHSLSRDITSYNHASMYATLLKKTLENRLQDPASSMGWLTPGQQFLLDEYQARYCLRGFTTHLAMIRALMARASSGTYIDASLLQFSFTFCLAHIQGQRPDNYHSVTKQEQAEFLEVLGSLHDLLRLQLEGLSHSFPFCLPDGGLKSTLRLFSRVTTTCDGNYEPLGTDLSKLSTEVCNCLRKAALLCYKDVVEDVEAHMAEVECTEDVRTDTLEFLVNLSEECIDQMGQSQVDYAKAFGDYEGALEAFEESFWSFYEVDLGMIVQTASVENGKVFQVFEQVNTYLLSHEALRDGKFHSHLLGVFMPLVASYLDVMSVSLEKEMVLAIAHETWRQEQSSVKCAEDLFVKLRGLHRFVQRLAWPEPLFADHLEKRVQRAISDLLLSLCHRTLKYFEQLIARQAPRAEALYIAPRPCWVAIDVVSASIEEGALLCMDNDADDATVVKQVTSVEYGANIRLSLLSMQEGMINAVSELLNFTVVDILNKLSLHDPANVVFSLLNKIRTSRVDLDDLSLSIEHNLQSLQECTGATPVAEVVMTWYDSLLALINEWLEKRPRQSLKFPQFDTLQGALEVIVHRFVVYFNTEQDARTTLLTAVEERLRLEQSAHELAATVKSM